MKPKSPGKPQQRTKSAYEPRSLFRNINASTLQRTETILILIDVGAQAFVVVLMPKSYFVPVPDDTTPTEERFFADMDAAVYARYVSSGAMLVYLLALVPRLHSLRSAALRSRSDRADIFVLLLLLAGLTARWYPEYEVTSDIKQYEFVISLGYLCLLALHFILKPDARTLSKRLRKIHANSSDDHIQISIESSDGSFERKPSTAPTAFTAPASRHANTLFGDVQLYTAEDIPEAAKVIVQQDKHTALKPPKHLDQEEIYEQVLITGELRGELWAIETKKLERQLCALNKTSKAVSNELDKLNTQRVELEADRGKLMEEEEHYSAMIEQLKMQESFKVPNPEFIRANALAKHRAELKRDISKMTLGKRQLLEEQVILRTTLDELESELSRFDENEEDDKTNDDKIFLRVDPNASPAEQLAVVRKKMRLMDNELVEEQRKKAFVEREMEVLSSHLAELSGSSSSSSSPLPSSFLPPASSFESLSSPRQQSDMMKTLAGFLDKGPTKWNGQAQGFTSWTMRGTHKCWCEIGSDGRLRFHKRAGDTEVLGEIDLADASFEIKCDDDKEFVLCTSDQQTRFFTKNTGELHIWVRALLAANLYLQTKKDLDVIADELDAAERRQQL